MKNSDDIHIFDESNPLLETRRNILYHDNRGGGVEISTVLVELPDVTPNAPPSVFLENRRRSTGANIVNTQLQLDPTGQEGEALESFMSSNYRKSIQIEDNDQINRTLYSEGGYSEIEFEIIEPLKVDLEPTDSTNIKKESKPPKPLTVEEDKPKKTKDIVLKEQILNFDKSSSKTSLLTPPKKISDQSNINKKTNNSCKPLELGASQGASDSAHTRVVQKSPFTNKKSDSSDPKASRLKITLMLVPSDSEKDIENRWDRSDTEEIKDGKYKFDKNKEDNSKKIGCHKTSVAGSREDELYNFGGRVGKSDHRPNSEVVKFNADDEGTSNSYQKRSYNYKARRKQTPFVTEPKTGLPTHVYYVENQSWDNPGRNVLNNSGQKKHKRSNTRQKMDKWEEDKSPHRKPSPEKAEHPNSAKSIVTRKRYHIQLLRQEESDHWFNSCISIDENNKVDMKYEGPVKITNYYSAKQYK